MFLSFLRGNFVVYINYHKRQREVTQIYTTSSTSLINDDQQGVIAIRLILRITYNKLACFDNVALLANYGKNVEASRSQNHVIL